MKRDIIVWQVLGFAFVSVLGTILHFLYDWTGNTFAALFSAVNESTFEHMKLLFFPMLLFSIIESFFFGSEYENFWCVKLEGTLQGLLLIPVLFYTLTGIFGTTPDIVNISVFFVSAALASVYETRLFKKGSAPCKKRLSVVIFAAIAVIFGILTFFPPEIPLFRDPISGSYGLCPS